MSRLALFFAMAAIMGMTSCTSAIFDDEGDCSVHCQLKFKYDMNMKFADAFANAVPYVTVYVYDAESGALVHQKTEGGPKLAKLGTYDIVAWCGDGLQEGNFDVVEPTMGESKVEELICTMDRGNGGTVTKDVKQLFHGKKRVTYDQAFGVKTDTISLTKNTNTVRVVLQHLSGIDVDPSLFEFEIKDENGVMAHDNKVMDDEVITYSPWSVYAGSAGIDSDIYGTKAQTSVSVAIAEFTTSRLVTENNPVLSVNSSEGLRSSCEGQLQQGHVRPGVSRPSG